VCDRRGKARGSVDREAIWAFGGKRGVPTSTFMSRTCSRNEEDRAILGELDVICKVLANLTHPVRVFLRVHAQVRPIDVR
jgi:hypothetical protein